MEEKKPGRSIMGMHGENTNEKGSEIRADHISIVEYHSLFVTLRLRLRLRYRFVINGNKQTDRQ